MATAFISYSWDSEAHSDWVKTLATRLRQDGIASTLDQWSIGPGASLTRFMESLVQHDFVLTICTPAYKKKFDDRTGGAGFEAELISGQQLVYGNRQKFIPVLRLGDWKDSAPNLLLSLFHIDLRSEGPERESKYCQLIDTLHGRRHSPPPVRSQALRQLNDGTILDEASRLVWSRVGDEEIVEWDECQRQLQNLGMQTGWDWRLPTEDEVSSVIKAEEHHVRKPIKVVVEKHHPWFGRFEKKPWTEVKRQNVSNSERAQSRAQSMGLSMPGIELPGIDAQQAMSEARSIGRRFLTRFVRNYRDGEENFAPLDT